MATSYNGWEASSSPSKIGIVPLIVDGVNFAPGCKSGPVHTVLSYVAHRLITEVEPAGEGCWGYAYRKNRNANNLSCHASGTAFDFNAPKHPNGKRGTFTPGQVAKIEQILAAVGVVAWGGHFHGTPDEMHFEIHGTPAEVGKAAERLTKPLPRPTPKRNPYNHSDDLVRWTQWALGLKVDGHPGAETWTALRKFQAAHGIREQHYPGPLTIAALSAVTR